MFQPDEKYDFTCGKTSIGKINVTVVDTLRITN